jgi:hypothetical protein
VKVGDLVRITNEGADNIDEIGIDKGSVGIIVQVEPDHRHCVTRRKDHRGMGELYTIIVNNRRMPYLCDCEIEKL